MKFKIYKLISKIVLFGSLSFAEAKDEAWMVKEEFLSLDIDHFDCHSSSITETGEGALYAVWKGGPGVGKSNIDLKENIGVWSSRFDGKRWSDPLEIVTVPHSVCWNPVLFQDPSGELLLFYRVGPDPRRVVSFMKRSQDGGMTWSTEEILPAGIVGPTKNKPLLTADGALLCPSSVCVGEPSDRFKATSCWIEITKDKGIHWEKVGPFELSERKFGVIEPALFYDKEGNLKMYCRDRGNKVGETGYIWEAISMDGGWHWSAFQATQFPNPDSGFDVVDLGRGKLVLIYNHSFTDRFPLNFAVSVDGGDHWSLPNVLDKIGEFPAAILTKDGMIHVTYAIMAEKSGQRRIKHVVIDPHALFPASRM